MKIVLALLLIAAVQGPDPRAEFERLLPNLGSLGQVPNLIFSDDEDAFLRGVKILHDLRPGPGDPERMVDLHLIPFRRAREKQWTRGRDASEWFILAYARSSGPNASDRLRAQLLGMLEDSNDPADRKTLALITLAQGKAERPQLLEFVKDARTEVRSMALHRLADLNDPADTGLIASFLADDDSMLQHSAIQMLTRRSATEHIDAIAKFLDDRLYFNRRAAIGAIGRMKVHRLAPRVVPFLADPTERGEDARTNALEALKALDPGAVIDDVAAFCSHADARVRRSAVALIGHWKSKRHTRLIASMLRDPDDKVREEAVDALAAMRASNLTGLLAERLDDDSEMVRSRAAIALGNIGAKKHAGTIASLGREGRIAKGAAAHALILLDGADRTETLVDLLDGMAQEFRPSGHLISMHPARIPSLEDLVALAARKGLDDCIVGLLQRAKEHAPQAETMILRILSDAGAARLWKKLSELGLLVSTEARAYALRGFERTLTPQTVPALMDLVRTLDPYRGLDLVRGKLSGLADAVAPFTEDESSAIRKLAGMALCNSRQTKHLRRLIRLMEDPDKEVRAYITQNVDRMPSTDHHEAIGRRLYDPEPSVRREAAIAISSLRLNRFTPDVVGLLKDPDPEVVDGVLYALEFLDYRKEVARIVPLLENTKWAAQAAGLLGKWGGAESIEPLLTLANEGTPESRGAAIRALALLGANDRLSNLDALLEDKEEHVRSAAAYAVGILKDSTRKPTLVNLLKDSRHVVKAEAATALAELGAGDQVTGIMALLELPDEQRVDFPTGGSKATRDAAEDAAAAALVKLSAVEAAPTLARLLKKSNAPFAPQRLASALIRLDAKRYVPEILSVHVPEWSGGTFYEINRARAPRLYDRIGAAAPIDPRVLERGPLMHRARRFSQVFGVRIVIDPSVPDEIRRRDEILMITGDTAHQIFADIIPPECAAIFDDDAGEVRIVPLAAARKFWLEWAGQTRTQAELTRRSRLRQPHPLLILHPIHPTSFSVAPRTWPSLHNDAAMTHSARRRTFLAGMVRFTTALPLIDWSRHIAQQRVPRIGFMSGAEPSLISSFEDEMRKLGYVPGKNIHIEIRIGRINTNDAVAHAAELGAMDLDFVVVAALPQALVMRQASPKMPMVIITCPGMVSNGFAASLERPGGIYTGMDELPPGVTRKRLQLLKRAVPSMSRVALLSTTPGRGGHETQLEDAEHAARDLGFSVRAYRASSVGEITTALDAIRSDQMNGLLNFQGGLSLANRQMIVDFAAAQRLPAVYQSLFFVEAGGLMAWAPDQREQYRLGARYADRILKGTKPGDIPVQHPEPYQLHLNKRAAAAMGLTLPADLIAEADNVLS